MTRASSCLLSALPLLLVRRAAVSPRSSYALLCSSATPGNREPPLPPPAHDAAAADGDPAISFLEKAESGAKNQVRGGTAYFVSTPIGNLEDITLRAVRTLRDADIVASEDTRVAAALLRHLGIVKKHPLVSHHDHNLERSVPQLIGELQSGRSVAVVSDAGTPGISDPGLLLAAACNQARLPVVPIPGACAAVAALSVAGLPGTSEFVFAGFIPRAGRARRDKVAELAAERRAFVVYEAPHRMVDTLGDLSAAGAGGRPVSVARELTKLHEEFHRGTVASAYRHYADAAAAADDGRLRGEFTLVVGPMAAADVEAIDTAAAEAAEAAAMAAVAERLAGSRSRSSPSRLAKEIAAEYGVSKSKVYAEAMRLRADAKASKRAAAAASGPAEEDEQEPRAG